VSKVTVQKVTAAAKKRLTLGKASFSIPSGQKKNVKIKLSKAALKLLSKKASLKALAKTTVTANGTTRTGSKKVTLKKKK
jgi:hypothetical protein